MHKMKRQKFLIRRFQMRRKNRQSALGKKMIASVMLFFFLGFLLLYFKDSKVSALYMAGFVPLIIFIGSNGLSKLFPADRLLLSLTNFLCALGVLVLYRLDVDKGMAQALNYGVGVVCMLLCALFVRYIKEWKWIVVLLMAVSLVLVLLPLKMGKEINGAKNWLKIGGFGFQPSELVKISLILSLAFCMSRRKFVISILFAGALLLILMLQKDLGTALLYYGVTLLMVYAATGSKLLVGLGTVGGAGAAVVGYQMFAHVKKRVSIWLNPWADYQNSGYQIVQGLIAIANGGIFGVGLGLGNPSVIPEFYNDYIFTVIAHEFGVVVSALVLFVYLAIILRGIAIARRANSTFHSLCALGCATLLALQTFVIVGGNIKLIPLTGVTLPFISYGGTSMVSSLCIIGIMQGIASLNRAQIKEDKRLANFA